MIYVIHILLFVSYIIFLIVNLGHFAPNDTGVPLVTISPSETLQVAVVGGSHTMQCTAAVGAEAQNSDITFYWIGPDGNGIVSNNRINISSKTFNGVNEHASILWLSDIMEEDEGTYVCSVTAFAKTAAALTTLDIIQGNWPI